MVHDRIDAFLAVAVAAVACNAFDANAELLASAALAVLAAPGAAAAGGATGPNAAGTAAALHRTLATVGQGAQKQNHQVAPGGLGQPRPLSAPLRPAWG